MTILDDAHKAIPGYTEAQRAVDTTRQWLTDNVQPDNPVDIARAAHAELLAAARAGNDLPAAALDAAIDGDRIVAQNHRRTELLRSAYDSAQQDLTATIAAGVDAGYAHLRKELTKLYADVNTHRDALGRAATAEDAIRAGTPDAYTLGADLTDQYQRIRDAHAALLRTEGSGAGTPQLVHAGQAEDTLNLDPYWHAKRRAARNIPSVLDTPRSAEHLHWLATAPASRESDVRTSIWPANLTRVDWLLRLARTRPYVPNGDTINERYRLAHRAVRAPIDHPSLDDALAARAALDHTKES